MSCLHASRNLKVYINFPWKFWKLPDFIFRLTPHNLQKSLAFSSWGFLPLTGFVGVSPFANSPLSAMHVTTTKCTTITFTPIFCAKSVGSNWLSLIGICWGQWGEKVGGIQNTQVLWQAVWQLQNSVEELNSGLPRTNPDSSRVDGLNLGPPDFKSSTLSHSTMLPLYFLPRCENESWKCMKSLHARLIISKCFTYSEIFLQINFFFLRKVFARGLILKQFQGNP